MRFEKNKLVRISACVVLCITAVVLCFKFDAQVLYVSSQIAIKSVCTVLPSSVLVKETESSEKAEQETKPSESEQDQDQDPVQTEETASPSENVTEEVKTASVQQDDFYSTPQEIKTLIKKAQDKAANDKKDGAIYEKQYKNEGVTDSHGRVKIKNTNKTKINVKQLLEKKADLSVTKDKPSVLIFHTHTTECYQMLDRDFYAVGSLSRSNSSDRNMIKVGDAICERLEKAGFNVIHDTAIYDTKYNGAYERSREKVKEYLKKYPSIQVTLDIHRDAIETANGTKIKPTVKINDKKAAQVMIISGCQEAGNGIENFPDWKYNLIFAAHLQDEMEKLFPGLTRPMLFCPRRYNMNLTRCSLLLEVGSDSNTLEEAYFSGRCIGEALSQLLEKYTEEK